MTRTTSVLERFKPFWRRFFTIFLSLVIIYNFAPFFNIWPLTFFTWLTTVIGVFFVLINLSWQLTRWYHSRHRRFCSPKNRAVLVTGCDSGFGHRLAQRLDEFGFYVFAGCLFPDGEGAQQLKNCCSKRCRVVKLDVTDPGDVNKVVKLLADSGKELWAVVNNAGISHYSLVEMGKDIDTFEKIFAVNVFGLVRVTKACLPLLRKTRGARVVNMASTAGRFTFAGLTAYCMTKYSVRSFSDGLRREMHPHGIRVVAIEPNLYRTSITDYDLLAKSVDRLWDETDDEVQRFYGGDKFKERFKDRLKVSVDVARPQVDEVVNAQQLGVTLVDPDPFYRCAGAGERPALWLLESVSDLAQDYVFTGSTWKRVLKFFGSK